MKRFDIELLLTGYPDLPYRIKEFSDKLNMALECKQNAQDTLKAYKYSHDVKCKTISNPVFEAVQKSMDIHGIAIEYYQRTIDEYTKRLLAMEEALKVLDPHERRILDLRYWQRREWKYISQRIHYDMWYCMKLRTAILQKLISEYKETEKTW